MKKVLKALPILIAPVLAWEFSTVFLYTRNVKEVAVAEALQPAGIFLICAAAALLIGALLFRDWKTAAFFSVVNGLVLTNFEMILTALQKTVPQMRYWHLLYLTIILSIALCIVVRRFKLTNDAVLIASLVFGGLILFNLVTAMPTIIQRISDSRMETTQMSAGESQQSGKRNIYYLLCDEYASFAQLQEEFGFDNGEFRAQVEKLGFNVSETSENDSDRTVIVMANLMQLDYVADSGSTSVELENLTKNGKLQQLLVENGYRLRGVGNTEFLNIEGTRNAETGATTADGTSLSEMVLANSFLGPFFQKNYLEGSRIVVETLDDLNGIEIEPNTSTFTFFYVSCPHIPYYFDENGNMNTPDKWANDSEGSNNDAYIGAVKFTNSRVLPAVKRIIREDPEAIVVLCSDHGNRFGAVSGKYAHRILNLLYYGGEEVPEFEGLSSINTVRMILNRECGLNLEYIDLPTEVEG